MDYGKITLRMADGNSNAVTENLGYTLFNITAAGQSAYENAQLLCHAGHSICNLTNNLYVETSITYEIIADSVQEDE